MPGIGNFLKSGDFDLGDLGFFKIWGFLSRGFGIFIPAIWDFLISGDFYLEDLGFFKIWGFLSPRFFGDGDFFVVWDIPPKSHLWLRSL